MPLLTIERADLIKLLEGETLPHQPTSLRVTIDEEVLKEIPPPLITDLVDYLKG